jgi:hypothetical protein
VHQSKTNSNEATALTNLSSPAFFTEAGIAPPSPSRVFLMPHRRAFTLIELLVVIGILFNVVALSSQQAAQLTKAGRVHSLLPKKLEKIGADC